MLPVGRLRGLAQSDGICGTSGCSRTVLLMRMCASDPRASVPSRGQGVEVAGAHVAGRLPAGAGPAGPWASQGASATGTKWNGQNHISSVSRTVYPLAFQKTPAQIVRFTLALCDFLP